MKITQKRKSKFFSIIPYLQQILCLHFFWRGTLLEGLLKEQSVGVPSKLKHTSFFTLLLSSNTVTSVVADLLKKIRRLCN